MTGRRTWRWSAGWLATGLVAALTISGCGSGDERGDARPQSAAERGAPVQGGAGAPGQAPPGPGAADQAKPGANPAQAPAKLVPENRSIIYTGSISVRVSDVDAAATAATAIVTGAGGFVGGDNRTINANRSEAKLALRVPSERFTSVVNELGKLGKELNRAVSTEDVTEQVVDVNARIATSQASVDRVRALLARAGSIGEIVQLESEVARREAELESLKARQRKLTDLAALSTITVTLLGDEAPVDRDEPDTGFLAGLKGGWGAFLASMNVLMTILGALLPWFLALGLPVLLLVWLLRRSASRRAAPVPAPVPPGTPARRPEPAQTAAPPA